MNVKLVSDLHLEFLDMNSVVRLGKAIAKDEADVLVMAGDICELKTKRWRTFLREVQMSFSHIIWVPGNHEYYGSKFAMVVRYHRMRLASFKEKSPAGAAKVHFLDNQTVVIDNVNFIGTTLWTDFDKENPLVMNACQNAMNDFYQIKYGPLKMCTADQLMLHKRARPWIFRCCREGSKRGNTNFVITHHGPSWASVHPKYKSGRAAELNGAYVSDLSEDILDHSIHTWVHGHTHENVDYPIGDTNVYVNPFGYRHENACFNFNFVLEID